MTIPERMKAMDGAIHQMLKDDQEALRNAKTPEERDRLHKEIQSHKEILNMNSEF